LLRYEERRRQKIETDDSWRSRAFSTDSFGAAATLEVDGEADSEVRTAKVVHRTNELIPCDRTW